MDYQKLFRDIFESYYSWAHLPYLLFVVSTLMRRMVWLRSIAVVAGALRIFIRTTIVYDPVTAMWETVLLLVNIGQLAIIWFDDRHTHQSEDEALLAQMVLQGQPRRLVRRLLEHAEWRTVPPASVLAKQGEPLGTLMFVVDGVARIERDGVMVAICSRGDFIGEMSFISGDAATATVTAEKPMRMAVFDQDNLRAQLDRNTALRHALDAGFNRNLVGKLNRSGQAREPGRA